MTADRDSRQQLQHHTCFVAARAASDGVALSLRSLKRRRPALALALLTAVSKQSIQSTQPNLSSIQIINVINANLEHVYPACGMQERVNTGRANCDSARSTHSNPVPNGLEELCTQLCVLTCISYARPQTTQHVTATAELSGEDRTTKQECCATCLSTEYAYSCTRTKLKSTHSSRIFVAGCNFQQAPVPLAGAARTVRPAEAAQGAPPPRSICCR